MSYRGRLTAQVQRQLSNMPGRAGLTDTQITALRVDNVDVSLITPDAFLTVDCSMPMTVTGSAVPTTSTDPTLKMSVALDQRTALSLLMNGLLDETNVPKPSRTPIRDVVERHNQRVYDALRRSADDQR